MLKKILTVLIVFIFTASLLSLLSSCSNNSSYTTPNDLIAIKVNNFMAEWDEPSFNYNYKGSNQLRISIPYTNVLSITDAIVSPGSDIEYYSDQEYKNKISNIDEIPISKEKTIHIKVLCKKESRYYKLLIKTDMSLGISNNAGGHLEIAEDANVFSLNEIDYIVVRTIEELQAIDNDLSANYILANDIDAGDYIFKSIGKTGFGGIFNGNNYVIKIKYFDNAHGSGIFHQNGRGRSGIIRNIIFKSDIDIESETIFVMHNENESIIENCVNYANVNSETMASGIASSTGENFHQSTIRNCINYGDISSKGKVAGIAIDSGRIYYCYNIGNIRGSHNVGGIVSYSDKVIENASNLGDIEGNYMCGGIAAKTYGLVEMVFNYGSVRYIDDYDNIDKGDYFGGIIGDVHTVRIPKYNINYGQVDRYKRSSKSHHLFGNYENISRSTREELDKFNK